MHAGRLPTLSYERKKECSKLEEKAPYMHTLHHRCTQKKAHVCIDDMVSIWWKRMRQTWSNTKAKATKENKRALVVVHKVGIIEASLLVVQKTCFSEVSNSTRLLSITHSCVQNGK
jgi:hypothetical protein